MKWLDQADIEGKRVLVRIDANLPIDANGRITDDYRLKAILPTLHFILNNGGGIVLISHLGRPKGRKVKKLSLRPVCQRLSELIGEKLTFWSDFPALDSVKSLGKGQIAMLENLRYEAGEEKNSRTFARKLAMLGDIYVNDAFAVSHREAASLCAITDFLPSYAGLLMEKEVKVLKSLITHPAKPFVILIGGLKVEDKLPVIKNLMEKADMILCSGVIANTFVKALNIGDIKKSPTDQAYYGQARGIYRRGKGKVILPVDFVFDKDIAIDIGPESIKLFSRYLRSAKTILWNGCPGLYENPKGGNGSVTLAKVIAESLSTSVIGGGNTLDLVNQLDIADCFSFISTGGGAMLEYLSGKKLPGISALE